MTMLRPVARAMRASARGSRARLTFVGSITVCPPARWKSVISSCAVCSSSRRRLSRFELKCCRTQPTFASVTGWCASALSLAAAGSRNITSKSMSRCSCGSVTPRRPVSIGPRTVCALPESAVGIRAPCECVRLYARRAGRQARAVAMPTVMSHAVIGLTLGTLTSFPHRRRAFWLASAILPVLPDLDVFGRAFGISFYSTWGHRGMSHSFAAAAVIGVVAALLLHRRLGARPAPLAVYFAAITASHGVLDALTDGGPGVAFFAPFDT